MWHCREVTEEYNKEVLRVTEEVLELLSEGLSLERKALKRSLGGDEIELEMKINMYPPCPQPELALGVEPHTDMSAITVLVPNDVPGFQLWKDGHWVAADYLPNALFIHIGDQIEVFFFQSLMNSDDFKKSIGVGYLWEFEFKIMVFYFFDRI